MQYLDVFKSLNHHHVKYIVVGGIAVNLHGIARATMDLDIIVALDPQNLLKFSKAMDVMGFKPKVPVATADFADPENRRRWREEKGMVVFSFYHPKDPFSVIDVFVEEPMPFDEMNGRKNKKFAFGVMIPIASIEDIIVLKKKAGRPKDMFDLSALGEALSLSKNEKRTKSR